MTNRAAAVIAVVVTVAVAGSLPAARARVGRPSIRQCRTACGRGIGSCIAGGVPVGKCLRSAVRQCTKMGLEVCTLQVCGESGTCPTTTTTIPSFEERIAGSWDFVGTWRTYVCPPPVLVQCDSASGAFAWHVLFYEAERGGVPTLIADLLHPAGERIVLGGGFQDTKTFHLTGVHEYGTATDWFANLSGTVQGERIEAVWLDTRISVTHGCCSAYKGTMTRPLDRPCFLATCPPGS